MVEWECDIWSVCMAFSVLGERIDRMLSAYWVFIYSYLLLLTTKLFIYDIVSDS